jgi:hypothetical protein
MGRRLKPFWLAGGLSALTAAPVWGQPISLADLDGTTVEESVLYDRFSSINGDKSSYQVKIDRTVSIAGNTITDTEVDSRIDSNGTHVGPTRRGGSWTLGQPKEVQRLGGGHKLWTFSNGTLTLLRVFVGGGYSTQITFQRTTAGLTCTVKAPLLHEIGTAELSIQQNNRGQEVHILSSKQISSSCKVTKST